MGVQRVYSRATPYPAEVLKTIDWTQTADIMYTVHIDYMIQKLSRYGHTDWRWNQVVFGPTIDPPSGASATPTKPNTTGEHPQSYYYVITGINEASGQESRASSVFSASNDLSLAGNYNTINLPSLGSDYNRFVIYKKQAGVFGYIGNTAESTFRDENIQPALSETPPEGYNPFSGGAGYYPSSVCLHQQRLCLAGSQLVINGHWMSRSADWENMDRSRPVRADDSLQFSLVSEQVNAITHLASLKKLITLTGDSIWATSGDGDSGAITASAIVPSRETGRGASRVKPVVVDEVLFYFTSKGRQLRTLGFSFDIEGYKSDNVSIFAPHLFAESAVQRAVFQEEPYACLWCLRLDGTLICLTWELDQQVWGWTRIEIDGTVEDIAVITESGFDRLYAIIRRTIGGSEIRSLERLALPNDIDQACHLDCSLTKRLDVASDTLTGLWHLEGKTVSLVIDGFAYHDLVVTNGAVSAPNDETGLVLTAGLRFEGMIETLTPSLASQSGSLHVERQEVTDVVVRTIQTKGISVGVNGSDLEQVEPQDGDDVNAGMDYSSVDYEVPVPGDWNDGSTVVIKQTEPHPAHIVGIFEAIRLGGA